MRIPKIKLIVGIILILIASMVPAAFMAQVLSDSTDTVIGGFDLSGAFVQFFVIVIGSIGTSMIKDVFMRSSNKKKGRFRRG